MGFRLYRSIRLGSGVRLNLSKTGLGLSFGIPGLRYSIHSSGRTVRTVGVPGTGMYWRTDHHLGSSHGTSHASPPTPPRAASPRPAAASGPPHPGVFAGHDERDLWEALRDNDVAAMDRVATDHPDLRVAAETLAGLHVATTLPQRAQILLGQVFATGADPAGDAFLAKYVVPFTQLHVTIAPGITADLPVGREAVGLVLAELDQAAGELDAAIDVVEQLGPDAHTAVSLADLYVAARRFKDAVDLTNDIKNVDDATALLLVLRGAALRELGDHDAARMALTDALRARSRPEEIRHRALLERARTNLADGRKVAARRDLERILATDASYPGLTELLAQVPAPGGAGPPR